MYKAFRTSHLIFEQASASDRTYKEQAEKVKGLLSQASSDGRLDGTLIRDTWFPQQIDTQVFISHSHRDLDTALKLSNWLKNELGVTSFIDSSVWLYADDLLRELDNEYCYQKDAGTYSYEKRNGTTAHVHMMLAAALSLMLDSCECALFIDTPNSVSRQDALQKTGSPWIMYELNLMGLIRTTPPTRPINFSGRILNEAEKRANASINIDYKIDLSNLSLLSTDEFNGWLKDCQGQRGTRALDILYQNYS